MEIKQLELQSEFARASILTYLFQNQISMRLLPLSHPTIGSPKWIDYPDVGKNSTNLSKMCMTCFSVQGNFEVDIKRAKVACKQIGQILDYHFTDASKMISVGKSVSCAVKIIF